MNKIKFGSWEATTLMVNLVFTQVILIFPKNVVLFGGSASWIIPIIITCIALIYFAIVSRLYKNIGSLDLIEISDRVGGRVFKVIVGILIIVFLMLIMSIFLGGFSQTLKIISLDNSPLGYVQVFFLAAIIVAAYYGIENIARVNSILVPIVIIGFLLITLGVMPKFNVNNLFPILGNGIGNIVKGSVLKLSVFASFIILFLMVPFFKKENLRKVGYSYIITSGLLLLWSTLSFILVFPNEIAAAKKIPIYQMARHIEFGYYIQRVESIFVLLCSISLILFSCAIFAFIVEVIIKAFDLKKRNPIILPMAIIVFTLSLIFKRMNVELLENNLFALILLTGIILPFIIVIIGAIKKVGENEKGVN